VRKSQRRTSLFFGIDDFLYASLVQSPNSTRNEKPEERRRHLDIAVAVTASEESSYSVSLRALRLPEFCIVPTPVLDVAERDLNGSPQT
jgi:hypothetical protein